MARICMIVYTDYGGDSRVRREAEALVARGDAVDVICPRGAALGDTVLVEGVRLHLQGELDLKQLSPVGYIRRYLAFLVRSSVAACRLHRGNPYDLIQIHTMPDFLVFAALYPKLRGTPVLLDVHDLMPELYVSKFGLRESHWLIRLLRFVERRSVAFADRALAVHQPHLEALLRHGNPQSKFEIVMNSPDPRIFVDAGRDLLPGDRFRIVYHGTISRRHGLETAIRAVGVAVKQHPDIELAILGDGDDVARLAALVEELGLGDSVSLSQGFVPIDQLRPILAAASAGIVPIANDSFTRYMLPVKLLEYVALGIPVICSRTETIEAYFDDTMLSYFTSGDVDGLAASIVALRRDPGVGAQLAKRAALFLEEHDWPHERERYFGVVDSLLNDRDLERIPERSSAIPGGSHAD